MSEGLNRSPAARPDAPAASAGRHLACFVFPDFGHVNPTVRLTRELVARGHRVTYVIDERYAGLVAGAGGRVVPYRSARSRLGSGRTVGVDEVGAVGFDFLVETIGTVLPKARSLLDSDVPDAILYDFESFAVARMLGRTWNRPTVQLFPYLASNEVYSPRVEMFDPHHPSIQRGRAALEEFLASNGMDPASVGRFAAECDDRNLVFIPREFQTEGETFDERFAFVGPSIAEHQGPAEWLPPADGSPVLLVSLGTESNGRPEFFRRFAEAFHDGRWRVVMTLGRGSDPAGLPSGAPNLEAHEWLPHAAVLPHAQALVCHGGMGSIMEALYFGAPVVVVPHTPEHLLSGRRVGELGLGCMLHGEELTADALRSVVDDIAGDPAIRKQVEVMQEHVRSAGGPRRAADALEAWLARRPS